MKAINLSNVQEAGTGNSLKAGGYVCKYTQVADVPDKEYLYMEFDVAEGEQKDYFKKLEESKGFWAGKCYRSYKEAALPMFKRMCSAVTKSNAGFIFDGGEQNANEATLIGKLVGIVLGEEEYIKNNGDIGTRLYVSYECDAEKIRKGDFKVPDKKVIDRPTTDNSFVSVDSNNAEEVPFN
ncbi:MAG: hypothetical protein Q4A15_03680 [Prevotellaceae bacterium]|nr:hypothetical protein [Prevotellaceae bacterium]